MQKISTGNKWADYALLAIGLYLVYRIVMVLVSGISGIEKVFGVDKESRELEERAKETGRAVYFDTDFWYKTLIKAKKIAPNADKVKASITATIYTGRKPSDYVKTVEAIYKAKAGVRIGSVGLFGGSGGGLGTDNEEALTNAFKNTNSQYEISLLSYLFGKYYGRDLFGYIDSFVTNKTIDEIRYICENKPEKPAKLK